MPQAQPVVILGGFLSFRALYRGMRDALRRTTGGPVAVVPASTFHWLPVIAVPGWSFVLDALDATVRRLAGRSSTGKVTVVGHSAGGVLARLYLSPRPFRGRVYGGLDYVDRLITLGSPHTSHRMWLHGGLMARWMEERYPGAFFAPDVHYTAVAGGSICGDARGSVRERQPYRFYSHAVGRGDGRGDGVVPVASALLPGATAIVLDDVSHYRGFGPIWYGTPEVTPRWWEAADRGDA